MLKRFLLFALLIYIFPVKLFAVDPLFAPKVDYSVGALPYSVFSADLDGDSDKDLISANRESNTVSVLKNNGNGTFSAKTDYDAGNSPISVFASDLDVDGDMDLAVANASTNGTVSILFNNGDATFGARIEYPTGNTPYLVFVSKIDTNVAPDLAVVNFGSDEVSLLYNNGVGGFSNSTNYNTGNNPASIFAADLDGDIDNDLAITNYGEGSGNNVSVLKNLGNGAFSPRINFSAGAGSHSVYASDLDGDGDQDLAIVNAIGNSVSILKNDGSANFTTDSEYVTGANPAAIFVADLDGDSISDVITANYGSGASNLISVLKNAGNGFLSSKIDFGAGNGPYSVFAADLDEDENQDLVVANLQDSSVSVLINLFCANVKGDLNHDEDLAPSDVVLMLNCVFLASGNCDLCFTDVTCNGTLTPSDVVVELNAVFLNEPVCSL